MFRKFTLRLAVIAVLTTIGGVSVHGRDLASGLLSESSARNLDGATTSKNNESTLYVVWYRSSPSSRWNGIGPLNYYDACQVEWALVQRGYQTNILVAQ
jgi:hypothetical protein